MTTRKIMHTSAIVAVAIALVVSLSQTQSTTAAEEPNGNSAYKFAEGVYPQATFTFREATVTYDFQAFDQVNHLLDLASSGVSIPTSPEFTLERIVGNTPYLHRAVDQTWEYFGPVSSVEYPYKRFDVTVDFIQAGEPVRTLKYGDCSIKDYRIKTKFDKEEGWMGKGFAVAEIYIFSCAGFKPIAPLYDQMAATSYKNGK